MRIAMQLSVDTKALVDRLRVVPVGEVVGYDALDKDLKLKVRESARGSMTSARRILLKEGLRFDVVRGVGLKRMSDSEIARSGARSVRLVRAAGRREAAKMAALGDFEALSNDEKVEHNATLSVLGAIAHFTKPTQVKILEGAVAAAKSWLPTAETIEVMRLSLVSGKRK